MISNYFKITLRSVLKQKGFNLLNIWGLAVGIATAGLIFLWVEDELTWNHYFPNRDHIYLVKNNQTYDGVTFTFDATPGPLAEGMMAEIPGVKYAARASFGARALFSVGEKRIYETGYYADSLFFDIFRFHFFEGRPEGAFRNLESVIISKRMARQFFGKAEVVGKTILVGNEKSFTVKAVFDDLPSNVSFDAVRNDAFHIDWFVPFALHEQKNAWLKTWNSNGILTYVDLDEKANLDRINKRLYDYMSSKDTTASFSRPFLHSMERWHLHNKFFNGKEDGGRIGYVKLFTTIAWIILLIACINFMNLATARSEKRAKEVGIRKVSGAGRRMLIFQFICESLLQSSIAAIAAIVLVLLILPLFNRMVDKDLSLHIFAPLHLFSTVIIIGVCGLLAGSYPAFYLSSFKPVAILKGLKAKPDANAIYIRKGLVILQFAISVILIIYTIAVYKQISFVQARNLGFSKDRLVYLNLEGGLKKKFYNIRHDLLESGAIENATLSSSTVSQMGSNTGDFTWEGKDPEKQVLVTVENVSPEYINTMGLSLLKGRDFQSNIPADSTNIIINEAFATVLAKKDVVGTQIRRDGAPAYTIVGVVKNHLYNNLYSTPMPLILFCDTSYNNFMTMRMGTGGNLAKTLNKTEAIISKDNPGYPVDIKFVDEDFGRFFKSERLVGRLSAAFALLAVVISCLGLFGLSAYNAEQKTKEIGIRKVLGASVQTLVTLLSKDFVQLVLVACLIAFPVAWWYIYHWLENFEYRIHIEWWIFISAAIIALLIAVLTVGLQAMRVARANPVKNLRSE